MSVLKIYMTASKYVRTQWARTIAVVNQDLPLTLMAETVQVDSINFIVYSLLPAMQNDLSVHGLTLTV